MVNGIYTQEQLTQMKEEFNAALRSTNRPGVENLINWLETGTDFYTSPASQCYHGAFPGGLLAHSLNVYHAALKFREMYTTLALPEKKIQEIPDDSLIITTLLHDLCKANSYQEKERWFKDDANQWCKYMSYEINDPIPLYHGYKSVFLIQHFMFLKVDEGAAVAHHMMSLDPGMSNPSYTYLNKPVLKSLETMPIVLIVAQADMAASFMMEQQIDQKTVNRL